MPLGNPRRKNDLFLLAAFCLFELSIAVIAMAIWMKGDRSFTAFVSSKPGLVCVSAIGALVVASVVIINQYVAYKRSGSSQFSLLVVMNLVTLILMIISAEIAIRAGSRNSFEGETVGGVVLRPKSWQTVAHHYRQLIDRVAGEQPSYLVYDDLMGWTIGPNRRSANGLYRSSSDGIRAPQEGAVFPFSTGKTRVALVGDSFTFGEDVRYEETWGYFLEKELGSNFQTLNFGVSGYGLDQIFLRYEKDIRKWNPRLVIFGFISNDTVRSMLVYPFLSFPDWDMPFAKPRFILRDGELTNINWHPPTPEAIFSAESISELASVEYDKGYNQSDWVAGFYHRSYLARLFVSSVPRWSRERPDVTDEALVAVNASILKKFSRSSTEGGVIPLVVIFPNREELNKGSLSPLTKKVLQQSGISYTDLTSCLLQLNADDRFVPEHRHYSPQANALVSNCLSNVVNQTLSHLK